MSAAICQAPETAAMPAAASYPAGVSQLSSVGVARPCIIGRPHEAGPPFPTTAQAQLEPALSRQNLYHEQHSLRCLYISGLPPGLVCCFGLFWCDGRQGSCACNVLAWHSVVVVEKFQDLTLCALMCSTVQHTIRACEGNLRHTPNLTSNSSLSGRGWVGPNLCFVQYLALCTGS
jgi:hypothetical protein